MSDDHLEIWKDPEMEARIIAMIAGEASAFEQAELQRALDADADLMSFYQEMLAISKLTAAASKTDDDPAWKLADDRRQSLLETFSSTAQQATASAPSLATRRTWNIQWRNAASIAACLMLTIIIVAVMFPGIIVFHSKIERKSSEIITFKASGAVDVPMPSISNGVSRKPSAPSSSMSKLIGSSPAGPTPAPIPEPQVAINEPSLDFGGSDDIGEGWGGGSRERLKSAETRRSARQDTSIVDYGRQIPSSEGTPPGVGRLFKGDLAKNNLEDAVLDQVGPASRDRVEGKKRSPDTPEEKAKSEVTKLAGILSKDEDAGSALSGEKRPHIIEEIQASEQAHSTFSLNVSDVSFQLAQAAMLERGESPSPESIRTEEFINAFDYGDPQPSMHEKVSCAMDQAAHPFLQQRNLLRLSMSTAAQGRKSPLDLTVLLDNSGSMDRADREATTLKAIEVLASQLRSDDRITLISFANKTRILADRISGDQAHQLVKIVSSTPSEGGTNLEQAILFARNQATASQRKHAQSRIVVITDGAANLGNANPESLSKIIEAMRHDGLAFDACGIGTDGLDDDILEALTRKGDGRYYVINRPEDADTGFAKQLAGALSPAAKNVKIQVVFNPDRVGSYRLLGFEKHRLHQEDFRNDQIDAAEMAAEESGTALYQLEAKPAGTGAIGTVFVRFQDTDSGEMIERSWSIPYLPQAPHLKDAKPSMQLASIAGLLGEKLHGTDAGTTDFTQLNEVLENLKNQYPNQPRVRQLIEMGRK